MSEGSEAKKHDASDAKLKKQRKKGSIASSTESAGFLGCGLGILLIYVTSGIIWSEIQMMISLSSQYMTVPFDDAAKISTEFLAWSALLILLPILTITLATSVVTSLIYNGGIAFSMTPVLPKLDRVSMKSGFKRIYGKRALLETPVSMLRIYSWLTIATFIGILPTIFIVQGYACDGTCLLMKVMPILKLLTILAVLTFLISTIMDMIIQKKIFQHEQKMTDTEVNREMKDNYGSAEIRQERAALRNNQELPKREPDLNRATLCFFYGSSAVAIEFRPPSVTLPHVMMQARTAAQTKALRESMAQDGWPELENKELTEAGLACGEGYSLDRRYFETFADNVASMFERN